MIRARRASLAFAVLALAAIPATVLADGPGPGRRSPRAGGPGDLEADLGTIRPARPPTRRMGDSDYVGSAWGLGKPSYYGIGTRPDWGRSSVD